MVRRHLLQASRAPCRRTHMPKEKKPKAVMVDDIPTKPISPAEHRRLTIRGESRRSTKSCGDGTRRCMPPGTTRLEIADSIIRALQATHAPPTHGFINAKSLEQDPSSATVL